jgi:hypothetical protein
MEIPHAKLLTFTAVFPLYPAGIGARLHGTFLRRRAMAEADRRYVLGVVADDAG